jgi:quercetin dioxygenase-like cupin family protein
MTPPDFSLPRPQGSADRREALFGGRKAVRVWDLLDAHRHAPEPFTAVLACELEPSGSVGRHVQDEFAEIVVGLEGVGEASVDGQRRPLATGDVVHLPLGAVLALRNLSDDAPLYYLIIKARAPAVTAP